MYEENSIKNAAFSNKHYFSNSKPMWWKLSDVTFFKFQSKCYRALVCLCDNFYSAFLNKYIRQNKKS